MSKKRNGTAAFGAGNSSKIREAIEGALEPILGPGFHLEVARARLAPTLIKARAGAQRKDATKVRLAVRLEGREGGAIRFVEEIELRAVLHDDVLDEALPSLTHRWTLAALGFVGKLSAVQEGAPSGAAGEGAAEAAELAVQARKRAAEAALAALREAGAEGLSLPEIAERLQAAPAEAVPILGDLEAAGLARRLPSGRWEGAGARLAEELEASAPPPIIPPEPGS